jgi:MFS transporter, PAT family, beta-lactamase induction signal transducer AmpG
MLDVFRSRKMMVLALLGFASGLPLYLTSRTLQAWMTVEGVKLSDIGFFTLASLPYSLKFLWSPLVDRFSIPGLGRRRTWLIVTQLGLVIAIAAMALQQPQHSLRLVAVNAIIIAFLSATQDITVDAYRTDIVDAPEVGAGAGVAVLGYRVALILTGAVALILADRIAWPAVYLLLAGVMLVLAILSLAAPEPATSDRPPASLREAAGSAFTEFFQRLGGRRSALILAFVVMYKLGDAMITNMVTPFLLQSGFTQTNVGSVQGGLGLFATIAGVLWGGAVISRIGIYRSLWVFGAAQAFSNLAYLMLAKIPGSYSLMVLAIIIENLCTGLGTAALVGFLTILCNARFSATQYALLSSVMAAGRDVLAAPSGVIAQAAGWPLFFLFSFFAAIPAMALLPFIDTEPYLRDPNKHPTPKLRGQNY